MTPLKSIKLLIVLIFLSSTACSKIKKKTGETNANSYELVWSDEFDYTGMPDTAKWNYSTEGNSYGWGNHELQFYTKNRSKNAWVEDGKLVITAIKENYNGKDYTSARLTTKEKGDWKYGRIEARAKLPFGKGTWPAFWMMPTDNQGYGWPACGEIDIMEHVGYDPGVIHGTVHTESYNHRINTQKGKTVEVPNLFAGFHTYAIEWDENEIRWYADDELYFTFKNEHQTYKEWPFDKQFHVILNIAVGGDWGGRFGVDDTIFPQSMVVDYVRVFQKKY